MFRRDAIRAEIKELKTEYKNDRKPKSEAEDENETKGQKRTHDNEMVQQFLSEQEKYSHLKKDMPKKGGAR